MTGVAYSAMWKLSRLISVMRLITGIPVPKIHRRTLINRNIEAGGTGGTWPGATRPGSGITGAPADRVAGRAVTTGPPARSPGDTLPWPDRIEEYLSLRETAEILADPAALRGLAEARKSEQAGHVVYGVEAAHALLAERPG